MSGVRSSLREVESALSEHLNRREKLLKDSRDIISSCSRAIISVHGGKMRQADADLAGARRLLVSLRKGGEGHTSRYLIPPETEFVEAASVIAIARGRAIPTSESLGVSPEAYLLGLLDTVGELKRLVLDSIMHGDVAKAERLFSLMQELYSLCSPLAVYDHVVNGARRKIDVARMLVEDTRGLMTEEMRRESVISSMGKLQKKLDRRP
ncbi:MAG: RNA-binding protein [Thaumarchaeota archaeon]|nr:RNA-binding protein [Nitrososphaerota archaeon]